MALDDQVFRGTVQGTRPFKSRREPTCDWRGNRRLSSGYLQELEVWLTYRTHPKDLEVPNDQVGRPEHADWVSLRYLLGAMATSDGHSLAEPRRDRCGGILTRTQDGVFLDD